MLLHHIAHHLGFFYAVGIASVGITAVAYHSLRRSVGDIGFRHSQRRALDLVLGIYACRLALDVASDKREIQLVFILPNSAVYAVGFKSLGSAHSAFDFFHIHLFYQNAGGIYSNPLFSSSPNIMFIFCIACPAAPLTILSIVDTITAL